MTGNRFYVSAILLLIGLVAIDPLAAERVRGPLVGAARISGPDQATLKVSLRDLAALDLDSDSRLLESLTVSVALPPGVSSQGAGLVLWIYDGITPEPTPAQFEYTATGSAMVRILPGEPTVFSIPVEPPSGTTRTTRPTTVAPRSVQDAPFLFVLEPISKAIPDTLRRAEITITITPVFAEVGLLDLDVQAPFGAPPFLIYLDEQETPFRSDGFVLSPGLHSLRVESEGASIYDRTLLIEKGTIETVVVIIESNRPTVRIEAPEDAMVFLDGQRYRPEVHRVVEVTPGEHLVLIQLGDYAISRRFDVEEAKDYTVSLFLDIIVEESR